MPGSATDQGFHAELLSALDEGVAATDVGSRITFWNRRAQEILGWTADEALGRPALELLAAEPSAGARDRWFASLLCTERQEGELACRRRDGSRIFVDARWTVLGEPGAPPRGVLVSMRDATERRRTAERDEALAADNARLVDRLKLELAQRGAREARIETLAGLYALLSRVNEAIVRVREERQLFEEVCRILAGEGGYPLAWIGVVQAGRVTPEAVAGSARAYVDGLRVELTGPWGAGPTGTAVREGRPVVNDDFSTSPLAEPWSEAAARHGLRASAAFPLRRAGQVIGALSLYAALPGAFDSEHASLLEALAADVSFALSALEQERRRSDAEHALRASERLLRNVDRRKNEFLAALSHELRNPLGPIRTSLYVLDYCQPGSADASRALEIIGRQVGLMTRLVDDLLDLTRVARGKITLDIGECELNEVVRRVVEDQRAAFERAGVALELEPSPEPVRVRADRQRLVQVLGNLLQNAVKFTPGGGRGRVCVRAQPAGELATLVVEDTGVGMTPETLAGLFEPFMQAEATRDRSRGGLGLGLALVKSLVEQQGGRVSARSAGPGQGSAFEVELPLAR